jgi:hypothetical protein
MAMRIDEAGHDGPAVRVYRTCARHRRCRSLRYGDDFSVAHNDRAALDRGPFAVENSCVRDDEALRGRIRKPAGDAQDDCDGKRTCSVHAEVSHCV